MVAEKLIYIALVDTGHFLFGSLAGLLASDITAMICVPPGRGAVLRIIGVPALHAQGGRWRHTFERPQTTLKTLRLVRQQSASIRKTRHGA